jgi:hypothetical protein
MPGDTSERKDDWPWWVQVLVVGGVMLAAGYFWGFGPFAGLKPAEPAKQASAFQLSSADIAALTRKPSVQGRQPTLATGSRSTCDPNYTGCVPVDSDVDCASGNGNGPSFALGPVEVVGNDVYGLDADGDGIACE